VPNAPDDDLTIGPAPTPRTPAPPAAHRFAPGAIVAGRYRLVALLGRGGMGEVYRADDLTLDQPVALKFLPAGVAADPARLAQFHNELRIARQVSHKNVCRLYDLGEADGRRFITMEYVDGEDLAALLRRIGRLPQDKAVEIARQLCAGLAAAHERGVLHRDLKPANVMLDGDGNVRIADFGLAIADSASADAGHAGTPQYMAPEQLAGRPASVKSDLYALGLVLFEIFTGRRAYDAKTLQDLKQLHESGTITTPSSVVRDLDPAIERVILRCLERDPTQRAASALAVAASLPGGDPIAAALAAGETPSPEMLAKAGEIDAVPAGRAVAATMFFLGVLAAFIVYAPRASITGLVPLDKPGEVLEDRAQQMLASFGYTDTPADRVSGFSVPPEYPNWIADSRRGPYWWRDFGGNTRPALQLWYRTSSSDILPERLGQLVSPTDPPSTVPGMRTIKVDTRGRLAEFFAIPPQHEANPATSSPPDWKPLFDAAGLNIAAFRSVAPEWSPRGFADVRAAWEGPSADRSDIAIRVEAAAFHGRAVSFSIIGPWTVAGASGPSARSTLEAIGSTFASLVWTLGLLAAVFIARHNLNANRADRKSAARLSVGLMIARAIGWIAAAHHVSTITTELNWFMGALITIVFEGATLWIVYLALEPYARRFWPDSLLGWSRFFSGRIRDPRVGRDVLIGLVFGAVTLALEAVHAWAAQALNTPLQPPFGTALNAMSSAPRVLNGWAVWGHEALISTLFITLLFIVIRLIVRRPWVAAVVGVALITAISNNASAVTGGWVEFVFVFAVIAASTAVLFRYGLLALAVALFVDDVTTAVPMTPHLSAWWAGGSNLTMLALAAIAMFGFYASRAGQPLFGAVLTRD
jgi:hypothetical protein